MHFHRAGAGEPLVLIHGIGSRWQVWRPLLPALAARYDVIAVDLPGFGESPSLPSGGVSGAGSAVAGGVPGSGSAAVDEAPRFGASTAPVVTVSEFADAVADLLARLDVRRPRVAGSSLGGAVALELGRRGQARAVAAFSPVGFFGPAGAAWCRAVVGGARAVAALLDPALPGLMATRPGRAALCGVFYARPGALLPADCVADARALAFAEGFAAARRGLGRLRPDAGEGDLARIPVTIAWGSRDLVLPRWQAERARKLLPNARHVQLNGCGHLPFADDPTACSRLLLDL